MQLPYPPYRGSRGWELYPWSYLVSYVWSHFPRVPSILQQHRLVLITVQQFVRLPYLDCLQTGPFQNHNEPTASDLASCPESGPLRRHRIPVLSLLPTAPLRRLEPSTGRSHLKPNRKLCNVLKLGPRARPNRKGPSGCHFESGRLERAVTYCLVQPKPLWEVSVPERGGYFRMRNSYARSSGPQRAG